MEHINTLCGQNAEFMKVKQVVHIVTTALYGVNNSEVRTCDRRTCVTARNSSCFTGIKNA
jgi:hypothetical protein